MSNVRVTVLRDLGHGGQMFRAGDTAELDRDTALQYQRAEFVFIEDDLSAAPTSRLAALEQQRDRLDEEIKRERDAEKKRAAAVEKSDRRAAEKGLETEAQRADRIAEKRRAVAARNEEERNRGAVVTAPRQPGAAAPAGTPESSILADQGAHGTGGSPDGRGPDGTLVSPAGGEGGPSDAESESKRARREGATPSAEGAGAVGPGTTGGRGSAGRK